MKHNKQDANNNKDQSINRTLKFLSDAFLGALIFGLFGAFIFLIVTGKDNQNKKENLLKERESFLNSATDYNSLVAHLNPKEIASEVVKTQFQDFLKYCTNPTTTFDLDEFASIDKETMTIACERGNSLSVVEYKWFRRETMAMRTFLIYREPAKTKKGFEIQSVLLTKPQYLYQGYNIGNTTPDYLFNHIQKEKQIKLSRKN